MSSLQDCEESHCPSLASHGGTTNTPTDDDQDSVYGEDQAYSFAMEPPSSMTESSPTLADLDPPASNDRGRLFLKVEGLKDIRLPLDSTRNQKFTLTLDNGLQTVTTSPAPLEQLKRTGLIPVDQEFELLVGVDLELILTLNATQYPPPRNPVTPPQSVLAGIIGNTPPTSPSKKKRFSFFGSPKRKEKTTTPAVVAPKDPWSDVVGPKGEFARAYIVESQFEGEIFGRKQTFVVSCFNEWAGKRRPLTHDFSHKGRIQKMPDIIG